MGIGDDEVRVNVVRCDNDLGDDDDESDRDCESSDQIQEVREEEEEVNDANKSDEYTSEEDYSGLTSMVNRQNNFTKKTGNKSMGVAARDKAQMGGDSDGSDDSEDE